MGTCLIFSIQGNHDGKVGQPGSVHATKISFVSIFFQQFYAKINFRVISLADERDVKMFACMGLVSNEKKDDFNSHIEITKKYRISNAYNHWLIKYSYFNGENRLFKKRNCQIYI